MRRIMTHCRALGFQRALVCTGPGNTLDCKIVVVGGGTAGCAAAAALSQKFPEQVAIVEPAIVHHNQPMWTLVGAGIKRLEETRRAMAAVLPSQAQWVRSSLKEVCPERNFLVTTDMQRINYDYLVMACGLSIDYSAIKGLPDALATPYVSTNYSPTLCAKTWDCLQRLESGNAVFTYPTGPVKCGGAGQKITYMAEDYFRTTGKRDNITVTYNTALPRIFGAAYYADALEPMCAQRGIQVNLGLDLVEVRSASREAVFKKVGAIEGLMEVVQTYDFLHVVPKQAPHAFLKDSDLVDSTGFVDVNPSTLQHSKHQNVFALGDCSNLPTSKTAAAVSAQLPVLLQSLQAVIEEREPMAVYNGYTSCPITTRKGKVMMCEFDYQGMPCETFPGLDQRKESKLMWFVKTVALPYSYWNILLKGWAPWRQIPRRISQIGKPNTP
ncbi:g1090 [Coccomyxa elongata]